VGWAEKFRINLENCRIFSPNTKIDSMKIQPYPDQLLYHSIMFSYHLPYFPNNMKVIKKYMKNMTKKSENFPGRLILNLTALPFVYPVREKNSKPKVVVLIHGDSDPDRGAAAGVGASGTSYPCWRPASACSRTAAARCP
jgi:hypothetical protein